MATSRPAASATTGRRISLCAPFNPCDTWCGMKCIRDNQTCVFENACAYRKSMIRSLMTKQRRMVGRYRQRNGTYEGYIPVSELVALSRVYLKTGFVCWYCGEKMFIRAGYGSGIKMFTADHRQQLGDGGNNRIENIVFCCYECNSEKNAEWQMKKNGVKISA